MKSLSSALRALACIGLLLVGVFTLWPAPNRPAAPQTAILRTATTVAPSSTPSATPDDGTHKAIAELKRRGLYTSLRAAVQKTLYRAREDARPGVVHAANPAQGFDAAFTRSGLLLTSAVPQRKGTQHSPCAWRGALHLQTITRGGRLIPVPDAAPIVAHDRVEYRRGSLIEWYRNTPSGLEQGFTIQGRGKRNTQYPATPIPNTQRLTPNATPLTPRMRGEGGSGPTPLCLLLSVTDGLHPTGGNGDGLALASDRIAPLLVYRGLKAWDGCHRPLPARMEARDGRIALLVDDRTARYPITIDPLISAQTELAADDGAAFDYFGFAVGVSGNFAIVGAPYHAVNGNAFQGAAYLFARNNSEWALQAELTANDGGADDYFGAAVSVNGNIAIVGAPGHIVNGNSSEGAAYVFSYSGGSWPQAAELDASDGAVNDNFGRSVSNDGATVLVGAPYHAVNGASQQGAAYLFASSGGFWTQSAEITSNDGSFGDQFGWSVSLDGSAAVAGAPNHSVGAHYQQGAAYVFESSGGQWMQQAEITSSDGGFGDQFGWSVSVSGSAIVVGAPQNGSSFGYGGPGAAYVFQSGLHRWVQRTKLVAPDGRDSEFFGYSVNISGTTIGVSAPFHAVNGNPAQGAAYIFQQIARAWAPEGELTAIGGETSDQYGFAVAVGGDTVLAGAPNRAAGTNTSQGAAYVHRIGPEITSDDGAYEDNFGTDVSVSGDTLVVGASNHNNGTGAAYVFTLSGTTWNQTAELTASDGASGDNFGTSVSISGDTLVVGSPFHTFTGAAYVFTRSGATWSQTAELTASDATGGDRFAYSVSISGDTLVVGSPFHTFTGAAYVFTRSGATWNQTAELTASDATGGDQFASSVSISGDTLVVGACVRNNYTGAAYVFTRSGTTWNQTAELTASDGAFGAYFGFAVSISGDTLVVGSPFHTFIGAAYVFTRSGTTWNETAELTASDATGADRFAYSISISGDTLVVGASEGNNFTGAAYLFTLSGATWNQAAEIIASDGARDDAFGSSVSISGDTIASGSPSATVNGNYQQGTVYVYGGPTPATVADAYITTLNAALTVPASRGVLANDHKAFLPWTVSLYLPPNNGTVALNTDGSFTYTPINGFAGNDGFFYTATNSLGETSAPTFAGIEIYVAPVSRFVIGPKQVTGTFPTTGTITLLAPAPIGSGNQTLTVTSDTPAVVPSFSVIVPEGVATVAFPIETLPVAAPTTVHLSAATNGPAVTATMMVLPPALTSLTLKPTRVKGGNTVTGTVTLNAVTAVPTAVQLSNANPAAALPPGATITIPAGTLAAKFTFTTLPPGASNATGDITAMLGAASKRVNLTVTP